MLTGKPALEKNALTPAPECVLRGGSRVELKERASDSAPESSTEYFPSVLEEMLSREKIQRWDRHTKVVEGTAHSTHSDIKKRQGFKIKGWKGRSRARLSPRWLRALRSSVSCTGRGAKKRWAALDLPLRSAVQGKENLTCSWFPAPSKTKGTPTPRKSWHTSWVRFKALALFSKRLEKSTTFLTARLECRKKVRA